MSKRAPCEHGESERVAFTRKNGSSYTRCRPCSQRIGAMGGAARAAAIEAADAADLELTGGAWVLGADRIRRWVALA